MNYIEYRNKRQEEYNKLPIYWAFSDEQFKRTCEENNFTEDDLVQPSWLCGGFCRKSDVKMIADFFNQPDELPDLMADHDFAVDAFYEEMCNHEYGINYQADWDVCNCFLPNEPEYHEYYSYHEYLTAAGHPDWVPAYEEALKKYRKAAEENDWF